MMSYLKNSLHTSVLLIVSFGVVLNANETQSIDRDSDWKVAGDLRIGYVHYDNSNPPPSSALINRGHTNSHGYYVVPKLSIITPTYRNFSVKTTVAGATDFGINNANYENRNFIFDSTEKKSFVLLQELYISYMDNSHNFTIGRKELNTPLIEADDYYLYANSFEVVNYVNSTLDNFLFHLGYFHKMAGTWDSGANGTEFHSMSDTSFVDSRDKTNANDSGVIYGAMEYKNKLHDFKVWDYYVTDLYNIMLAQYGFTNATNNFSYNLGAQITNYKEVGKLAKNNYTNIDYTIYSVKFDGEFDNGFDFATGVTKYSDGEGQGATLGVWGGFPSYTYGFTYSYFDAGSLQNSFVYKTQVGFDLGKVGLKNAWVGYRYTDYKLDPKYSKSASLEAQDSMQLHGFRIKYSTNVGVYFTGTYECRTLDKEQNSNALRLIGGYRF